MFLNLLFLTFALVIYGLFFYSFFRKNKTLFFVFYTTLVIFHDFVFIQISYFTTESVTFLLKAWQEYLFLFLILILLLKKGSFNKKIFTLLLLLFFLSFYGIVNSVINGNGIQDSILGWRMYLLPILVPCLVYLNGGFKNIDNIFFYKYLKGLLFYNNFLRFVSECYFQLL